MLALFNVDNLRSHINHILGSGISWVAVITADQAQVEFWAKMITYAIAAVVSVITGWSIVRRDRRESAAEKARSASPATPGTPPDTLGE